MMLPESIKERVQSVIQLPALPSVAAEIMAMVEDPRTSASALARVIATDPTLTAKVLKVANSPFYGFPRKVSTIDFAVIVLGYDALREIVVSISLVNSLQQKSDACFDAKRFWDHAVACGVVARRLARDVKYRVSGEVFVGGLLHDMGIPVLHRDFPHEFERIVDIARDTDLTFQEAEESVLGVTHADVGGWMAERWNLPDHLVDAIRHHHTPDRARRSPELVSLIHCADVLAVRLGGVPVGFEKGLEFNQEALTSLRLNEETVLREYATSCAKLIQNDVDRVLRFNPDREGPNDHDLRGANA